jgi:hypothetical protein
MGLEAKCRCRWSGGAGEVKAHLEARELMLRGDLARSFRVSEMRNVRVEGSNLCFRVASNEIALSLGADVAERWAKKIATPPPSLAQKLGAGPSSKVLVIGPLEDATLSEVLESSKAVSSEEARLSLAVVSNEAMLAYALRVHKTLPIRTPIWIVHGKGPQTAFGEAPVRRFMRGAGYKDNCVVTHPLRQSGPPHPHD